MKGKRVKIGRGYRSSCPTFGYSQPRTGITSRVHKHNIPFESSPRPNREAPSLCQRCLSTRLTRHASGALVICETACLASSPDSQRRRTHRSSHPDGRFAFQSDNDIRMKHSTQRVLCGRRRGFRTRVSTSRLVAPNP